MNRHNKAVTILLVGRVVTTGPRNTVQILVWCPHCKKHHIHGWNVFNARDAVEHRVAHCTTGPFREGGYFIGREKGRTDHAF